MMKKIVILLSAFLVFISIILAKEEVYQNQVEKSLKLLKQNEVKEKFSFIVCSDSHIGFEGADKIFKKILEEAEKRKTAFVVCCGDLVEKGNFKDWKELRNILNNFTLPFFPAIGNHDSFFTNEYYGKYMGDLYYSFDYENSHFVILDNAQIGNNATLYLEPGLKDEQWKWLRKDLTENKKKHKFVFMHFPIFGSRSMLDPQYIVNTTIEEREKEVKDLEKLFKKANVKYVFNGHIHDYEKNIRSGIIYIRCGGAGGETSSKNFHFVQVFVDGNKIKDEVIFLNDLK